MRATVLAVHPVSIATTRLRAEQFRAHLEAAGIELRIWSFLDERGLALWFGRRQRDRILAVLRGLFQLPRVIGAVRGAAVVVVQREALPFGPPIVEVLAAWRRRLVWDVDDSVWVEHESPTAGRVPQWLRATGGKHRRLCRRADEVWAGSEVLATWCRQHATGPVVVVPTVVSVPPSVPRHDTARVVSWIGSHSTGPFVEEIVPALLAIEPAPRVIVVGAGPPGPAASGVEVRAWSEAIEDATLAETRVGVYPIDRSHPLAEGKCGLKAILYMAHGVPCVVTPTTTNAVVVRDGEEGFHASTTEEWIDRVGRLLADDATWQRMSVAGHRRALEQYSLERWGPEVASRLHRLGSADGG